MTDTAGSRNNGTVDRLLGEAGFDDDVTLRAALVELRGLAAVQPKASAAVAALMAPEAAPAAQTPATIRLAAVPDPAASPPATESPATESPAAATDELAARRRAKRRITLTTLSLAASLAAGGAVAVASDQGVRDSIGQLGHAVTSFVTTAAGGPAPVPVQTPAPAPAQPGPAASHPEVPAATAPPTAVPDSGEKRGPQHAPDATHPAKVPLPDLPVPENATPGIPAEPLNGEGHPPTLPLPATPPVPVPGIHP